MDMVVTFAREFGVFAALFTFLLMYVLQQNANREKRYVEIIEKFAAIIDVKLDALEKTICDFTGRAKN